MTIKNPTTSPTILVILGATGDLFLKKIAPSLVALSQRGALPSLFQIIAFARRPFTDDEYRRLVASAIAKNRKLKVKVRAIKDLLNKVYYHQGNFTDPSSYTNLGQRLGMIDGEWRTCANKLFYVATPPDLYKTIIENLDSSGIAESCSPQEGWTRLIIEKPFGSDESTAVELDAILGKRFLEQQIYRIDHYLGKELLQNILALRFSNILFSDSWNNKSIERIDVRLLEKGDVDTRGNFYDNVGALRDVGQNHLLQMLALVTMDHPQSFTADNVRGKRLEILKAIATPTSDAIKQFERKQYDGYRSVEGVKPDSQTETYFKIQLAIPHERWHGVPLVLEAGKRMTKNCKEIEITFKENKPCMCLGDGTFTNKVIFNIEPDEKITIRFWSFKPGLNFELEQRSFEFKLHDGKRRKHTHVSEYERLLNDCLNGDQTLFVSTEEIKEMWRIIDPIIKHWTSSSSKIDTY